MSQKELVIAEICDKYIKVGEEEVFVPKVVKRKKIQGIWKDVEYIMFPGYIFFVTNNVEDLFFRLKDVKGLTKILRTGEDFTPIYPKEAEFLEQLVGKDRVIDVSYGYKEGDNVVITAGPMKNLKGLIRKIDRHKRIAVIEIDFFGRKTPVSVGLELACKEERKEG